MHAWMDVQESLMMHAVIGKDTMWYIHRGVGSDIERERLPINKKKVGSDIERVVILSILE